MTNIINTSLRSDRKANPTMKNYRRLEFSELLTMGSHALCLDKYGKVATVKITSIKTWKTRPEIEIHCKYGMYEYFSNTIYPDTKADDINFVVECE